MDESLRGLGDALPTAADQFGALVKRLAAASTKAEAETCNAALLDFQKRQSAYDVATEAFENNADDDNVRFFAALMIANRAKLEPAATTTHDVGSLVGRLLSWMIQELRSNSPSSRVVRRLNATLTVLYTHEASPWTSCVADLACSVVSGTVAVNATTEDLSAAAARCSAACQSAIFDFIHELGEEMIRVAGNVANDAIHKRANSNIIHIYSLLLSFYHGPDPSNLDIALESNYSWLKYAHEGHSTSEQKQGLLSLLEPAFLLLPAALQGSVNLVSLCIFFESTFKNQNIQLGHHNREIIANTLGSDSVISDIISAAALYLEGNDYDDQRIVPASALCKMALAFCSRIAYDAFLPDGQASAQLTTESADASTKSRVLIEVIARRVGILAEYAIMVDNDSLPLAILDFWEDLVQETRTGQLRMKAAQLLMEAIPSICQAGRYDFDMLLGESLLLTKPPEDIAELHHLDTLNDIEEECVGLRLRIRDLVQLAYEEYGDPFACVIFKEVYDYGQILLDRAEEGFSAPPWHRFEAPLYFLGQLSDSADFSLESEDSKEYDDHLIRILNSDFLSFLLAPDSNVPELLQSKVLKFVGRYAGLFERNFHILPATLRKIFGLVGCRDTEVEIVAAETIEILCSGRDTRQALSSIGVSADIVKVVEQTFPRDKLWCMDAMTPILQAAVSVAQSSGDWAFNDAVTKILELLVFSEQFRDLFGDTGSTLHDRVERLHDSARHQLWRSTYLPSIGAEEMMTCLSKLSEASQSQEDPLTRHHDSSRHEDLRKSEVFWSEGPGSATQDCLRKLFLGLLDPELEPRTEAATALLRTSVDEFYPGPFVFPVGIIAEFVELCEPDSPGYMAVAEFVRYFVSRKAGSNDPLVSSVIERVLKRMEDNISLLPPRDIRRMGLQEALLLPWTGVAKSCPRFLIEREAHDIHLAFHLALFMLRAHEPSQKRASAEFWMAFLSNLPLPGTLPSAGSIGSMTEVALEPFHFRLAANLLENCAGGALRSDLDRLVGPLRLLVERAPETRKHLESAIEDQSIDFGGSTLAQRKFVVAQLMKLRGSPKTRTVVRDFWMACRGIRTDYA